jgi:hypothetical protein
MVYTDTGYAAQGETPEERERVVVVVVVVVLSI